MRIRCLPSIACLLLLGTAALTGGCDRDTASAESTPEPDFVTAGTLPKPEAGAGSVTGMPDAGDAGAANVPIQPPEDEPLLPEEDADAEAEPPAGDDEDEAAPADDESTPPATGEPPPPADGPGPGAAEAAAVVRRYYAAIDARRYDEAYALWSGNGRSSGQSESGFAAGFEETAEVSASTGTPGRVEGAAGSRYVTVPVTIQAVHDDGSVHRYRGSYTLRRSVVDGATDAQRQWRIESADLREVPL